MSNKLLRVPVDWMAHPKTWYVEEQTPEQMWDKFIEHLNKTRPVFGPKKEPLPYVNFLGGIAYYRKIFLEANGEKISDTPDIQI